MKIINTVLRIKKWFELEDAQNLLSQDNQIKVTKLMIRLLPIFAFI